jgi:hypothetical protein
MSSKTFYKLLVSVSLLTVAILFLLSQFFPVLKSYSDLGWLSFILFFTITIMMFFFGKQAIDSPSKMMFSNVSMAFLLMKMLLSIMILVLYKKLAHPASNTFIVPFFIVYLIFTIFETYVMLKLTRK